MTESDFEIIAASLARSRMASTIGGRSTARVAKESGIRLATVDICATLANAHPHFNRVRFMRAAGFASWHAIQ